MAFEIDRARQLFHEGFKLVALVSDGLKVDLELFSRGGMKVLDAIEESGYDVLSRRPALSSFDKARLFVPVLLKHQLRTLTKGLFNGR